MDNIEQEILLGKVGEYIDMIGVAVVELMDSSVSVGDTIHFQGESTNFSQVVEEMHQDGVPAVDAETGETIRIKTDDKVQVGDEVFKVILQDEA